MKEGTLVRVRDYELLTHNDRAIAEEHGPLWIFISRSASKMIDLNRYRSIATGLTHLWFDSELEEAADDASD